MKKVSCITLFTAAILTLAVACFAAEPAPPAKAALLNADCAKCHAKAPADIEAAGGAHKSSVGCQDCHVGHPPTTRKIIPKCSQCHEDKPHYKLKDCLSCHRNPHTPKVITLGKNVTEPCLTCHTKQNAHLRESPSKHSALACTFCHDQHGKVPACTQCHRSHSADIGAADCKKCHQAHAPKAVTYAADIPSKYCAACHKVAFNMLTASKAKHSKLACAECHKAKHRTVPKCQECHGVPHAAGIMAKFPTCRDCHYIAHNLNSWPPVEKKPAPKPAKKAH